MNLLIPPPTPMAAGGEEPGDEREVEPDELMGRGRQ
jgi:hypothetical protein